MNLFRKSFNSIILLIISSQGFAENDSQNQTYAQGGTGNRISISNNRVFDIDENTVFMVDGIINEAIKAQGGTGFKAKYTIGGDVNSSISSGTLESINYIYTHKGPITSLDPLRVFNVDITVNADTFFDGITIDDLELGQEILLSGYLFQNSDLVATRIAGVDEPLSEWKISGVVENLTSDEFNLGAQLIMREEIEPEMCDDGIDDGKYVEVLTQTVAEFGTGDPLENIISITCYFDGVIDPVGSWLPAAIEGVVTAVNGDGTFLIGEQLIEEGPNMAVYYNGNADDIIPGVHLEVEGWFIPGTELVAAYVVYFSNPMYSIETAVAPADVIVDESITVLGLTLNNTIQISDDGGIISGGLTAPARVEIKGYIDKDGLYYISRLINLGAADVDNNTLKGQVEEINEPLITLSGLFVDVSTCLLEDLWGNPLTIEQFMEEVAVGSLVDVTEATFNAATSTLTDCQAKLTSLRPPASPPVGSSDFGLGIGTVNQSEVIFTARFE